MSNKVIESYKQDINDLEQDIKKYGSSPAAERTLKRLKAKLKDLIAKSNKN